MLENSGRSKILKPTIISENINYLTSADFSFLYTIHSTINALLKHYIFQPQP